MAAAIDAEYGREAFRRMVAGGPDAFFELARRARQPAGGFGG